MGERLECEGRAASSMEMQRTSASAPCRFTRLCVLSLRLAWLLALVVLWECACHYYSV